MRIVVLLAVLLAFLAPPVYAEDSAAKKAAKLSVLKNADEDSVAKKAVAIETTKDVVNESDSAAKKAVKLKAAKKVADE